MLFGCGGCAFLLLCVAIFAGGIFIVVMGAMRQSDAYNETIKRAQASSELKAALGEPIKPGLLISGSVNINNGVGSANIIVPVNGPAGSASIHTVGSKANGVWTYNEMTATPSKGGQAIDLLKQP